jgi:putative membrane protein
MVIIFVFSVIGKVGEVNEDPFENRITDVPMSAIANTIERDLKTMLGMKEIPSSHAQKDGYLY